MPTVTLLRPLETKEMVVPGSAKGSVTAGGAVLAVGRAVIRAEVRRGTAAAQFQNPVFHQGRQVGTGDSVDITALHRAI